MAEAVNHPAHYGGKDNPYETIKVARAKLTPEEYCGALKFMVMKYNDRHIAKNGLEDPKNGLFYQTKLTRFVDEIGHANIWPKPPTLAVHVAGLVAKPEGKP